MKPKFLAITLILVLAIVGVFVYPTPYYIRYVGSTDVVRVNRFTGVKEYATRNGWSTDDGKPDFNFSSDSELTPAE